MPYVAMLVAAVLLALLVVSDTATALTCSYESQVTGWLTSESVLWEKVEFSTLQRRNANELPRTANSRSILQLTTDNGRSPVLLHLLSSPTTLKECVDPLLTKKMTDSCTCLHPIIHMHQDVWNTKQEIVCSRLLMRLGRVSSRLFARKTVARRIPGNVARDFLQTHHLWSSTKAKHNYGLFDTHDDKLVAVATFSKPRRVTRNGIVHQSHELLRFCTRRDGTVVGGISKLIKRFVVDQKPDDIITVVDRDWGTGDGWHSLGFETVHVMSPLIMAVKDGVRYHLVGAGIQSNNNRKSVGGGRRGLPRDVLQDLSCTSNAERAQACLLKHGYYPVYDTGVERLMMLVPNSNAMKHRNVAESVIDLWNKSVPTYASSYYSNNAGVAILLKDIEQRDRTQ